MEEYAKQVRSGGVNSTEINDAMRWGSMCEDHAVATYIHKMPCKMFKKTGLWIQSDDNGSSWLGVSPDGIVDEDTVIEIKCPYMAGNPFPYRKVPVSYVPQCQLEMYATNTSKCHFVCWTPKRTFVYLIERDQQFIKELLDRLRSFWDDAQAGISPKWTSGIDVLKKAAQEISDKSKLLQTLESCRKENAMEHADFNRFWKRNEPVPKRKCTGCGKLQVICKLNPCKNISTTCKANPTTLQSFQSFTYGSGQVPNSCHTDTFLEAIFHPFTHQVTPSSANFQNSSAALDALLEAIIMQEQGNFHTSKMVLWNYLQNNTSNGQINFPIGKIASLSLIIDTLCKNMYQQERNALFSLHT